MLRKSLALVALLSVVLVGSACSKKSTTVDLPGGGLGGGGLFTNAPTATMPIEIPSGGSVGAGPSGVSVGTGSLPDGFPSQFPVPDGSSPVYSVGAGSQGSTVWFSSTKSVDELVAFFDSELPSNGWTVAGKTTVSDSASGSYTSYSISGNGYDGSILVGAGSAAAAGFGGNFAFFVALTPSSTGG